MASRLLAGLEIAQVVLVTMDEPGIEVTGELGQGRLPSGSVPPMYILRLYVTGKTPNSIRAVAGIKEVCEEFLPGQYQLQVVDIYQQPALAEGDHILVAPTLVRRAPGPLRRLIGNLYDRDRLLAGLELQPVAGG